MMNVSCDAYSLCALFFIGSSPALINHWPFLQKRSADPECSPAGMIQACLKGDEDLIRQV